jgi:hypothetical protein
MRTNMSSFKYRAVASVCAVLLLGSACARDDASTSGAPAERVERAQDADESFDAGAESADAAAQSSEADAATDSKDAEADSSDERARVAAAKASPRVQARGELAQVVQVVQVPARRVAGRAPRVSQHAQEQAERPLRLSLKPLAARVVKAVQAVHAPQRALSLPTKPGAAARVEPVLKNRLVLSLKVPPGNLANRRKRSQRMSRRPAPTLALRAAVTRPAIASKSRPRAPRSPNRVKT